MPGVRCKNVASRLAASRAVAGEKILVTFELRPIGRVSTPYKSLGDCPRNTDPNGPACELHIDDDFVPGLAGLTEGQHILVLYWFEHVDRFSLRQKRRGSGQKTGVFSLRSPHRPNPVGAAVVRIESLNNGCVQIRGMDCLDGTPLLDIKPALRSECTEVSG